MSALCQCGCGLPAPIATRTETKRGYVKGQPRRFRAGHNHRHTGQLWDGPVDGVLCECGCGKPTRLADQTNAKSGYVKGQPRRFILGHGGPSAQPIENFYKVAPGPLATPCWVWHGALTYGYGRYSESRIGTLRQAHHVTWERATGLKVPAGHHLDHLCRNPPCVNPEHLEPVTPTENNRRSRATKLTASQVVAIKALKQLEIALAGPCRDGAQRTRVPRGSRERIAAYYGVTTGNIAAIWRGRSWVK